MAGIPHNTIDTFWSRVRRGNTADCWEWTGHKQHQGYGLFHYLGSNHRAHRFAYALTHPEWDKTNWVLHTCDNPSCCNPEHLFAGDRRDNVLDMHAKGRGAWPKGERMWSAKLTADEVNEIIASPLGCKRLARVYGVTPAHINQIRSGLKWRHLKDRLAEEPPASQ